MSKKTYQTPQIKDYDNLDHLFSANHIDLSATEIDAIKRQLGLLPPPDGETLSKALVNDGLIGGEG